jgi:hypothetical protein
MVVPTVYSSPAVAGMKQNAGWAGRGDGELASLAAGVFVVFATVDENLALNGLQSNVPVDRRGIP